MRDCPAKIVMDGNFTARYNLILHANNAMYLADISYVSIWKYTQMDNLNSSGVPHSAN